MEKASGRRKRKIIILLIIVLVVLVLLFAGWNKLQETLFFHPWNDLTAHGKLRKIEEFQEIKIENKEVNLAGWFWNIQGRKEPAPLVIFFTGNAQNSSNTMYYFYRSQTMKSVFQDYNLMIIDYPGYGFSKGKPSDDSMFTASDYVFDYAANMKEVDQEHIVIMGYSIGTGVACYCASKNNASGLILIAPYDKAISLYNDAIDSFHGPVQSLAKYSFNSVEYAQNVMEPTLIFTSKTDEVISYKHSLDLAEHFDALEDIVVLDGVDHNGYFSRTEVLDGISGFLSKIQNAKNELFDNRN